MAGLRLLRTTRRRLLLVGAAPMTGVVLLAMLLAIGAPHATAANSKRHHHKRLPILSVRVLDTGQRAIVKKGHIKVRVRARHKGLVRLYVVIQPRKRGTAAIVITRTTTVRLKARRWRTIKLHLVAAGRSALAGCGGGRDLQARAARLNGNHHVPGRQFKSRRRRIKVSKPFCERAGAGRRGTAAHPISYQAQDASRCDPIDPAVCLQPFPNDLFTVADGSTATN